MSEFPRMRMGDTVVGASDRRVRTRDGDFTEAENRLQEQLSIVEGTGDWQSTALCYEGLGRLFLEKNDAAKAADYLNRGYKMFKDIGVIYWRRYLFFSLLSLVVRTDLRRGKSDLAAMHLKELRDNASQKYDTFAVAYVNRAEADFSASKGEWDKAADSLWKSAKAWVELGWLYERARTLFELGIALQKKGDRRGATEPLNEALEIFTRLGAKPDIERVLGTKELLKA